MCSLNNDQKQLLFDHTLGLADKYDADQVEELIASNYEAAEIHSNLKAVLSPLDTLQPEPCPDDLFQRTLWRLQQLTNVERSIKVSVVIKIRSWQNFVKVRAIAAITAMKKNFVITAGSIGAIAVGLFLWFATTDNEPDWGLHIAVLNVGQADAIVMLDPKGKTCIIDAGQGSGAAKRITDFLADKEKNGVGEIKKVKLAFVTHYDDDHMAGFDPLINSGIKISAIYDQGPSMKRSGASKYTKYLQAVGDTNDNMEDDEGSGGKPFIRKKTKYGLNWKLGSAKIRCLAVRGDTKGTAHDDDTLDPSTSKIDENPGSIALLVTLGDFEFYTAGDQSSDDWKNEPDREMAVVDSGAIGSENDIDVIKVSNHGSDTSSGDAFISALDPEVAIISSKFNKADKLPKTVSIKQFVENKALVYVTGDGHNPDTGTFTQSVHTEDDSYTPPADTVINNAGDVHIFVSNDGSTYKVVNDETWREFSAVDSDNVRED